MKKVLSVILSLLLMVNYLPVHAETYYTDPVTNIQYGYEENDQGGLTITSVYYYDSQTEYGSINLVIPDSFDDVPVTVIDSQIGSEFFRSIEFPASVVEIKGEENFADPGARIGGQYLEEINFADNSQLKRIGKGVFQNIKVKEITLPDSLEIIDDYAFRYAQLEAVHFGNNLQRIGKYAFSKTRLADVIIPDSVTEIDEYAFAECTREETEVYEDGESTYDVPSIENLRLGRSVKTIGREAFSETALNSVAFPESIENIAQRAFYRSYDLEEVIFPETCNPAFTVLDGFEYTGLKSLTIPDTIQEIGYRAFHSNQLTSLTIPPSVSKIGSCAFARNPMTSLTISEDGEPLTIGAKAFESCYFEKTTVILPERVSVLQEMAFGHIFRTDENQYLDDSAFPSYKIYNKYIRFEDDTDYSPIGGFIYPEGGMLADPFYDNRNAVIYYPNDISEDTNPDFIRYKAYHEQKRAENPYSNAQYPVFVAFDAKEKPTVYYNVSGKIPNGAEVSAAINGAVAETEMSGQSFSVKAEENSPVTIIVSMTGYEDKTFTSEELTGDWNIGTVTVNDLTPLNENGTILINTTGASDSHIIIFDHAGNLMSTGQAAGTMYLSEELPAGEYTVIAFAQNPYFTSISAEEDLSVFGISSDNYAKTTVNVKPVQKTEVDIRVPEMNISSISGVVNKSGIVCASTELAPNMEFYVRINYSMEKGHKADGLTINVPDGLEITYISSIAKDYGTDPVITELHSMDQSTGLIYVGLKAVKAGNYSVSAVINSGSVKVPLGNTNITVRKLILKVPITKVSSRSFPVTVLSEPNTDVLIETGIGGKETWKTNSQGYASGNLNLPNEILTGMSTSVIATVGTGDDAYRLMETIHYDIVETKLVETYFIHAGTKYYSIKDGQDVPEKYYTYIGNGEKKNKYWTFSATFEGVNPLKDEVTLILYMQDGSMRYETMSLVNEEKISTGYRQKYACTIYIEQAGDHIFDPSLIPTSYDLEYEHQYKDIQWDPQHMEYLRRKADADANERDEVYQDLKAEIPIDMEEELLYSYITMIFDQQYIISDPDNSNWVEWLEPEDREKVKNDEEANEWFDWIEPEDKEFIKNMEDSLEKMFEAASPNPDKPIDKYSDLNTFLEENGIDYEPETNQPYNPTELKNQGYEVSDDGKQAIKVNYDPKTDEAISFTYANEGKQLLDVDYTKAAWNNVKDAALGQAIGNADKVYRPIATPVLDGLNARVEKAIENHYTKRIASAATEAEKTALRSSMNNAKNIAGVSTVGLYRFGKEVALPVAGYAYGCLQAYNNSKALADYEAAVEGLKGDIQNMEMWEKYYKEHGAGEECLNAMRVEREMAELLLEELKAEKKFAYADTVISAIFTAVGAATALPSMGSGALVCAGLNVVYDVASNWAKMSHAEKLNRGADAYQQAATYRMRKCKNEKLKKGKHSFDVGLDPSGIVYEAVQSNVLEGVTATLYDINNHEDWNAASFGQINPQVTGTEGFYAWYVPVGKYKVNFTKEGYEDASTDELVVPPPQLGLTTGMIAENAPEVESIHAYTDYIEIIFNQYMDTSVQLDVLPYRYEWVEKETVSEDDPTEYAKVLHLIPSQPYHVNDGVFITLQGAKNYAGKTIASYRSPDMTVSVRPDSMILNYEEQISVLVGEDPVPRVTVTILDEQGNPIKGLKVLADIESSFYAEVKAVKDVTDDNGTAVFEVKGILPGMTNMTFEAEGTSLKKEMPLFITVLTNRVQRPSATIGEYAFSEGSPKENYVTVPSGTKLELSCETEDAQIYYTTDDTCPCQNMTGRTLYTEPVEVTEDTYFRISAYKEGMEYSERLNIHVTIKEDTFLFDDVQDPEKSFYEAVYWAYNNEITTGTSKEPPLFSPFATCTRAQFVTFLWRQMGKPEPTLKKSPFKDVQNKDLSYYKAVLWALENKITTGTSATTFDPGKKVTRGQVAAFLYRAAGSPKVTGKNPFSDVPAGRSFTEAVIWMVEHKITTGTSPTTFNPNGDCTRGATVTFLWRTYK